MNIIALLITISIFSCSANYFTSKDTKLDYSEGRYKENGRKTEIYLGDEGKIEYAGQMISSGEYEKAIKIYNRLYQDKKADKELRAKALYYLALTYDNLLYYGKDSQKVKKYLKKFLQEFPDSELRIEANEKLRSL